MKKKLNYIKFSNQSLNNYFIFLKRFKILKKKNNYYKFISQFKFIKNIVFLKLLSINYLYFKFIILNSSDFVGLNKESNFKEKYKNFNIKFFKDSYNNISNISNFYHIYLLTLYLIFLLNYYQILLILILIKINLYVPWIF